MAEVGAATAADTAAIRAVHLRAFPTSLEANLVERLQEDGDVELSLVAIENGVVVGHVIFSRMSVSANGQAVSALGLGPVAVLPDFEGRRTGSMLIEAGLAQAQSNGIEIVFVLGEPGYYGRFGFDAGSAAPFASPYAGPCFQAKVLVAGLGRPQSGRADYAAAFAELV